jgi:hypothetical protein
MGLKMSSKAKKKSSNGKMRKHDKYQYVMIGIILLALYFLFQQPEPSIPPNGNGGVVPLVEGDFIHYTEKWRVPNPDQYEYMFDGSYFRSDETEYYMIGHHDLHIFNISDGRVNTLTNYVTTGAVYSQTQDFSVNKYYFVTLDGSWSSVHIFKDGNLLETIPLGQHSWVTSVAISPTGRFIIVAFADPDQIVCFEGVPSGVLG